MLRRIAMLIQRPPTELCQMLQGGRVFMIGGFGRTLLFLLATFVAFPSVAVDLLPEGETGIAARYPGDAGISADSAVIFFDDFESYGSANDLTTRWDSAWHSTYLRIATEASNVYAGSKGVEMRIPAGSNEVSNELRKVINPTRDTLFVRVYTKFSAPNDLIGSSHNGIVASAKYCCAGVPANGTNKFLISTDVFRWDGSVPAPGEAGIYIYHPEQRSEWGDYWYPDGRVIPFDAIPGDFGRDFVARPDFVPSLDHWYCWEVMVKANTQGQRDGRIAIWVDGRLIADWLNVRVRDIDSLKMDLVTLSMHANAARSTEIKKYYDNVVIATSYIGPLNQSRQVRPMPPTNVRISN